MTSWDEEFLSIGQELSDEEKTQLLELAKGMIQNHPTSANERKKQRNILPRPSCPYCQSKNVVLNGKHREKQRYWCKTCDRTFVTTTNTVMRDSHYDKDIWKQVISDTFNGLSLDDIVTEKKLSTDYTN